MVPAINDACVAAKMTTGAAAGPATPVPGGQDQDLEGRSSTFFEVPAADGQKWRQLAVAATGGRLTCTLLLRPLYQAAGLCRCLPSWANRLEAAVEGRRPDERVFTLPRGLTLRAENFRRDVFTPLVKAARADLKGFPVLPPTTSGTLPSASRSA